MPARRLVPALMATAALLVPAAAHAEAFSLDATRGARVTQATAAQRWDFSYTDTLRRGGLVVGSDRARCSRSDPIYFTCELTVRLRGGSFRFSVPADDGGTVTGDLYGGTGRFRAVTGTMTITTATAHHATYEVYLDR